ncbi:MAG: hypothetical protein HC822_11770 [Oscillochloris sp.]|nr:hypothetical protein [Oscillochloris sp.]
MNKQILHKLIFSPRRRTNVALLLVLILLFGILSLAVQANTNEQTWTQVVNPACDNTTFDGAVLGISEGGLECGIPDGSYETGRIYVPDVMQDVVASAPSDPCRNLLGLDTGDTCYRMWYSARSASTNTAAVALAVSVDGVSWERYAIVLAGSAISGRFDSSWLSNPSVIKDVSGGAGDPCFDQAGVASGESCYRIWYTATTNSSTFAVGGAVSADGVTWFRVNGPNVLAPYQQSMLAPSSNPVRFDSRGLVAPYVIKDRATTAAPCTGVTTGDTCYRMWYEGWGVNGAFRIGYATSPDGIEWNRVYSSRDDGAIVAPTLGFNDTFDEADTGITTVVKDGSLYRMWYDGKMNPGNDTSVNIFSIGHATSVDGINWQKPDLVEPVWSGADDAITVPGAQEDNVWAPRVIKQQTAAGAEYWLYYASATSPYDRRIALARMTQGAPLGGVSIIRDGNDVTLQFNTTEELPVGGSVLITLPPEIDTTDITPLGLTNFAAGAVLRVDPAAVTDAYAQGVARGALIVDLSSAGAATPAGAAKEIRFQLPSGNSDLSALVQTFNNLRVLEQGVADLPAPTPTPTNTAEPTETATNTATPTATPTETATNTATRPKQQQTRRRRRIRRR